MVVVLPRGRIAPWAVPGLLVVALAAAIVLLRPWTREDPREVYERAITAFEQGDHAAAAAGLERVLRLRAPTPLDWGLRARLDMARGRNDAALASLCQIPDTHALASWAHLSAGQLELRRNRLPAAEAALRRALSIDGSLVQARRELIYILALQTRRTETDAEFEQLAAQVSLSYRETWVWCMVPDLIWWRPEENLAILRPCLEADPGDRWSRLAISENHRRLADYAAAAAILGPLPDDDPDARAMRARLELDQGRNDAARRLLDNGPADHAGLSRLRGQLAMASREGAEAVRQFRILLRLEPDRRDAASNLGRALVLAGDTTAAARYLAAGARFDTLATLLLRAENDAAATDRALLLELGHACKAAGRFPEARAWYLLVIGLDPLDREPQEAIYRLPGAASARQNPAA